MLQANILHLPTFRTEFKHYYQHLYEGLQQLLGMILAALHTMVLRVR